MTEVLKQLREESDFTSFWDGEDFDEFLNFVKAAELQPAEVVMLLLASGYLPEHADYTVGKTDLWKEDIKQLRDLTGLLGRSQD